jgi:hypothetical protein
MYSQNCERVVYRRRYIQNTMRQRKASKKQTLKSHPARRINHGIIPLLISSVFIRYVQIVSTFQKKRKKEGTIVNLIVSSSAQRKKKGGGKEKGTSSHPPNLLLTPLATRPRIPPFFSFWDWIGTAAAVVTEIRVAAIGGGTA